MQQTFTGCRLNAKLPRRLGFIIEQKHSFTSVKYFDISLASPSTIIIWEKHLVVTEYTEVSNHEITHILHHPHLEPPACSY